MSHHRLVRLAIALALAATFAVGCGATAPGRPSVEAPGVDAAALERLVDEAIAEVQRLAGSPPPLELPDELSSLLNGDGIELPALPSNAADICRALGTPGLSSVAGAGLGAVLESFAVGGELGLAAGLLVTVVFNTCPQWSPHLETVLRDLL